MAITKETFKKLSTHVGYFSHSTNIGVIEDASGILLIDTGKSAEDGKQLIQAVAEIFPQKKIAGIFITHAHSDHCGGNKEIFTSTGCEVYSTYVSSKIMGFPESVGVMYWGGLPIEELASNQLVAPEPFETTQIVEAGKTIEFESVSIHAVSLPGHFYGEVGFLVTDKSDSKRSFFLGDSFFGKEMLKKFWIPFIYDSDEFRKSIGKIEKTEADIYVPSHGSPCNPNILHVLAELNIMVTLEFETLIIGKLKNGPMTTDNLLTEIGNYAEIKFKVSQWILIGTTLRSYLACMEKKNIVSYDFVNNQLVWKLAEH